MPHLFTGLKIGAVGVMAGAITGEFLGGGEGWFGLPPPAQHARGCSRWFSVSASWGSPCSPS
jgi:NitT/TauT family transport system permease protein